MRAFARTAVAKECIGPSVHHCHAGMDEQDIAVYAGIGIGYEHTVVHAVTSYSKDIAAEHYTAMTEPVIA